MVSHQYNILSSLLLLLLVVVLQLVVTEALKGIAIQKNNLYLRKNGKERKPAIQQIRELPEKSDSSDIEMDDPEEVAASSNNAGAPIKYTAAKTPTPKKKKGEAVPSSQAILAPTTPPTLVPTSSQVPTSLVTMSQTTMEPVQNELEDLLKDLEGYDTGTEYGLSSNHESTSKDSSSKDKKQAENGEEFGAARTDDITEDSPTLQPTTVKEGILQDMEEEIPKSMITRSIPTFAIEYDLPGLDPNEIDDGMYNELHVITEEYLSNYFEGLFDPQQPQTVYQYADIDLHKSDIRNTRVEWNVALVFETPGNVPTLPYLYDLMREAFQDPAINDYLYLLDEMSSANPFQKTEEITLVPLAAEVYTSYSMQYSANGADPSSSSFSGKSTNSTEKDALFFYGGVALLVMGVLSAVFLIQQNRSFLKNLCPKRLQFWIHDNGDEENRLLTKGNAEPTQSAFSTREYGEDETQEYLDSIRERYSSTSEELSDDDNDDDVNQNVESLDDVALDVDTENRIADIKMSAPRSNAMISKLPGSTKVENGQDVATKYDNPSNATSTSIYEKRHQKIAMAGEGSDDGKSSNNTKKVAIQRYAEIAISGLGDKAAVVKKPSLTPRQLAEIHYLDFEGDSFDEDLRT